MAGKKYLNFFILLVIIPIIFLNCGRNEDKNLVAGRNGVVVSVDSIASGIGIEIMKKGGNAVDASVAVGMALAVTFPPAGNIGGGGFMVIHDSRTGKSTTIDFREKAPTAADKNLFYDKEGNYMKDASSVGFLAAGIPGTVRGFELVHKKYGKLPWAETVKPAVKLAKEGFPLSNDLAKWLNDYREEFKPFPASVKVFFKQDTSERMIEGDIFIQKDLAWTLEQIEKSGPDAFYTGEVADRIVNDMKKNGGIFTAEDMKNYTAVERKPVKGTYLDYEIITMPPPSSGGITLVQMLNILENIPLNKCTFNSADYIHYVAEVMKLGYYNRAKYLGDTDFYDVPVEKLVSKEFAAEERKKISLGKVLKSEEIGKDILSYPESDATTHYSVIDKNGLAVSTTYTINGWFGCYQIAEGTGILMNNEMDDFNTKPGITDTKGSIGTEPNLIAPNKRMLSSMTPAIFLKNNKLYIVTGSPGGRTIINVVLEILLNSVEYGKQIDKSVAGARFHHQWMPDILQLEKSGFTEETIKKLQDMGYTVKFRALGDAHSILVDPESGEFYGAADYRRNGKAAAY